MSTRKELKKWLDEIAETEGTITIEYEGGNDSGGASFEVERAALRADYPNAARQHEIVEMALDNLNYGSFAGDFNCNGTLTYDPNTGKFSGVDYYSEDEGDSIELKDGDADYPHKRIPIRIPKHLWFDEVFVGTEGYYDDMDVTCQLIIHNGPVTQEHADLEDTLTDYMNNAIRETINRIEDVNVNYLYNEINIPFSNFVAKGKFMVGYIDELQYTYENCREKQITFSITKTKK
jgi:hypothetical protein